MATKKKQTKKPCQCHKKGYGISIYYTHNGQPTEASTAELLAVADWCYYHDSNLYANSNYGKPCGAPPLPPCT